MIGATHMIIRLGKSRCFPWVITSGKEGMESEGRIASGAVRIVERLEFIDL